jgi:methionyl-tRNA formyltransferase
MNIVFMGTPEFACPTLNALKENNYSIKLVVTQRDKIQGRKRELISPPIKVLAEKYNLPVFQPDNVNSIDSMEYIKDQNPDLIIVVAYGKILKKEIIYIPKYGCINIHGSLLPKYRGPSPIQQAIINGDEKTGVTIMKMDLGMDTGPVILKKEIEIDIKDTGGTLHDKLSKLGAEAIIEGLKGYINGTLAPSPQENSMASYTKMLNSDSGKINWDKNAYDIWNLVRALDPWPSAFFSFNGIRFKLKTCKVLENYDNMSIPGAIVGFDRSYPIIQCFDSYLVLNELIPQNKPCINGKDFTNGYRLKRGDILC